MKKISIKIEFPKMFDPEFQLQSLFRESDREARYGLLDLQPYCNRVLNMQDTGFVMFRSSSLEKSLSPLLSCLFSTSCWHIQQRYTHIT